MKRIKFNTKKIPLTKEEKIQRAQDYNEFEYENIDVEEFANREIFDEYIEMKCLDCGYEETPEADIILECYDPEFEPYPQFICPHCNKDSFVPKDVYNELKKNK